MSLTPLSAPESALPAAAKVTPPSLVDRKRSGSTAAHPICAVTAYDFPTAKICDTATMDVVLVGDSLAMAVLGHPDTLSVTVDEMLHHVKAVRRGLRQALLVADMPYGSYHVSAEDALRNALRFIQEGGAEAVKLEGGLARASLVERLTRAEIPVMGHIGLTPQSVHAMGGYRVQGKTAEAAERLCRDALALQDAGAFALVLEGVPREVAARITSLVKIPTIGIGAGPDCDGQILVFHDVFNLTFTPPARFVRRFGDAGAQFTDGLRAYRRAVTERSFPSDTESYHLSREVREALESAEEVLR